MGLSRITGKKQELFHTKNSLKKAVNYLLDKCYFKLGNQISRQIIGIPMASDPAAFFADPFSFHYKSKGIKKVRKSVLGRGKRFGNVFSFIDDPTSIDEPVMF